MEDTRSRSYRKLIWLGAAVILLLVGGRVAWVEYGRKMPRFFPRRQTEFLFMGKRYQPEWERVSEKEIEDLLSSETGDPSSPVGPTDRVSMSGGQPIVADTARGFLGRSVLTYRLSLDYKATSDRRFISVRLTFTDHSSPDCKARATYELDDERRFITVHLVETYCGVSRKASFKFCMGGYSLIGIAGGKTWTNHPME